MKGVTFQAGKMGMDLDDNLVVTQVTGQAEKIGVNVGDKVKGVNGVEVGLSLIDFKRLISAKPRPVAIEFATRATDINNELARSFDSARTLPPIEFSNIGEDIDLHVSDVADELYDPCMTDTATDDFSVVGNSDLYNGPVHLKIGATDELHLKNSAVIAPVVGDKDFPVYFEVKIVSLKLNGTGLPPVIGIGMCVDLSTRHRYGKFKRKVNFTPQQTGFYGLQFKPSVGKLIGCGYVNGEVFFARSMDGSEADKVPERLKGDAHRVYVDSADYDVSGALNPVVSLYNIASVELEISVKFKEDHHFHVLKSHAAVEDLEHAPTLWDCMCNPWYKRELDYLYDSAQDQGNSASKQFSYTFRKVIEDYLLSHIIIRNANLKVGSQVEFTPHNSHLNFYERLVASYSSHIGVVAKTPPAPGKGIFVHRGQAFSYLVEVESSNGPSVIVVSAADISFDKKQAEHLEVEAIPRRAIEVLTQLVRFSQNPVSAALSCAYVCEHCSASLSVFKEQRLVLLRIAEEFRVMARKYVEVSDPKLLQRALMPNTSGASLATLWDPALELSLIIHDDEFTNHPLCEQIVRELFGGTAAETLRGLEWPSVAESVSMASPMQSAFHAITSTVFTNVRKLTDIDFILSPSVRFGVAFGLILVLLILHHMVVFDTSVFSHLSYLTVNEWVYGLFSVGFVLGECEELYNAYSDKRLSKYWRSGWNWIDWAYHSVFIGYAVLRLWAVYNSTGDVSVPECDTEHALFSTQECTPQHFTKYALRTLSVNCVLLWIRLMNVLTVFPVLGPYIRMLSRMGYKVFVFLLLLFMIIIGFAGTFHVWFHNTHASFDIEYNMMLTANTIGSALGKNLSDYDPDWQFDPDDRTFIGFATMEQSVMTLFSAAMGNFAFDELRNASPAFGPLLLAVYLFIALVMLLNLLIAILSDVYAEVQTQAYREINFAKTKALSDHRIFWNMEETNMSLPPPLNLLHGPIYVTSFALTTLLSVKDVSEDAARSAVGEGLSTKRGSIIGTNLLSANAAKEAATKRAKEHTIKRKQNYLLILCFIQICVSVVLVGVITNVYLVLWTCWSFVLSMLLQLVVGPFFSFLSLVQTCGRGRPKQQPAAFEFDLIVRGRPVSRRNTNEKKDVGIPLAPVLWFLAAILTLVVYGPMAIMSATFYSFFEVTDQQHLCTRKFRRFLLNQQKWVRAICCSVSKSLSTNAAATTTQHKVARFKKLSRLIIKCADIELQTRAKRSRATALRKGVRLGDLVPWWESLHAWHTTQRAYMRTLVGEEVDQMHASEEKHEDYAKDDADLWAKAFKETLPAWLNEGSGGARVLLLKEDFQPSAAKEFFELAGEEGQMLLKSQLGNRNANMDMMTSKTQMARDQRNGLITDSKYSKYYSGFKWAHVEHMRSQFLVEGAVAKGKRHNDKTECFFLYEDFTMCKYCSASARAHTHLSLQLLCALSRTDSLSPDMAYQFPAPLLVSPEDRMKMLLPIEIMLGNPNFRADDDVDAATAQELGTKEAAMVHATKSPVRVTQAVVVAAAATAAAAGGSSHAGCILACPVRSHAPSTCLPHFSRHLSLQPDRAPAACSGHGDLPRTGRAGRQAIRAQ
jgi:hypothetical protein